MIRGIRHFLLCFETIDVGKGGPSEILSTSYRRISNEITEGRLQSDLLRIGVRQ
jgi:hypothetical protein